MTDSLIICGLKLDALVEHGLKKAPQGALSMSGELLDYVSGFFGE